MNHNELKKQALKKQSVQDEYDALESAFSLLWTKLKVYRDAESIQTRTTLVFRWLFSVNC